MPYEKTMWNNDNPPAISADNLNKIEQGLHDAHAIIDEKLTEYSAMIQPSSGWKTQQNVTGMFKLSGFVHFTGYFYDKDPFDPANSTLCVIPEGFRPKYPIGFRVPVKNGKFVSIEYDSNTGTLYILQNQANTPTGEVDSIEFTTHYIVE